MTFLIEIKKQIHQQTTMIAVNFLFFACLVQFLSAEFTWQDISNGKESSWSKLAIDRSGKIIAAITTNTTSAFYISRNQGSTWSSVEPAGHYDNGVPWGAIAMDKTGTHIYAAASGYDTTTYQKSAATGIYVSSNGGKEWTKTFDLAVDNCPSCVSNLYQMSTSYDGRVVALASTNMQLTISEDYGKTWRYVASLDTVATTSGVAMDSTGQYIVSNFHYAIQRSTDYGRTWTTVTKFDNGGVGKMGSSADGKYLSFPGSTGPVISNDYGKTWTVAKSDWGVQVGVTTTMDETGQYMVAENSRIYESTDFGQSFQYIGSASTWWRDLVNVVDTQTGDRFVYGAAAAWPGYNVTGIYLGKNN